MRLRISLIMGTVVAVSSLSLATQAQSSKTKNPLSPPSNPIKAGSSPAGIDAPAPISEESLATVTAILNKCAQVDTTNANFYAQLLTVATSGHSPLEIQFDQTTADYKVEGTLVNQQLAAMPAASLVAACRTVVP